MPCKWRRRAWGGGLYCLEITSSRSRPRDHVLEITRSCSPLRLETASILIAMAAALTMWVARPCRADGALAAARSRKAPAPAGEGGLGLLLPPTPPRPPTADRTYSRAARWQMERLVGRLLASTLGDNGSRGRRSACCCGERQASRRSPLPPSSTEAPATSWRSMTCAAALRQSYA